jgi:hypothetical protein
MSEYQYYEFQAVDRPLTEKEMRELRTLSTRAEITPTSFWNEYHWGDFKGDPLKMVKLYFDAFLYFANWGTRELMLRLPLAAVVLGEIEPFCSDNAVSLEKTKTHVIFQFHSEDESGNWDPGNDPSLGRLITLRTELMHGDLRPLYLGWLAPLSDPYADLDDDEVEPPVPPGLDSLTASQKALADFLRIDGDLLRVSAKASKAHGEAKDDKSGLKNWIEQQPLQEKNQLLTDLVGGKRPQLAMELRGRYLSEQAAMRRQASLPPPVAGRRTIGELRHAAESLRNERQQRQALAARRKQEAQARQAEEKRKEYLEQLAAREEQVWEEVEKLTATTKTKNYEAAVAMLKDLRDLGEQRNLVDRFDARLDDLRAHYVRKPAFLQRLKQAGLI